VKLNLGGVLGTFSVQNDPESNVQNCRFEFVNRQDTDPFTVNPVTGELEVAEINPPSAYYTVAVRSYQLDSSGARIPGSESAIKEVNIWLGNEGADTTVLQPGTDIALSLSGKDSVTVISGDAYDNFIVGGASDDTISSGGGDDVLQGSGGQDVLTGGLGDDAFTFNWGDSGSGSNRDLITDFNRSTQADYIDLTYLGISDSSGLLTWDATTNVLSISHAGQVTMEIDLTGSDAETLSQIPEHLTDNNWFKTI
jgi:Ca2+-binding RTX toxin-like protein